MPTDITTNATSTSMSVKPRTDLRMTSTPPQRIDIRILQLGTQAPDLRMSGGLNADPASGSHTATGIAIAADITKLDIGG
jgi:hypothetical protein